MAALRDFVADLLESEGAVVEPVEPDGLEVLATEATRVAMGWPELARLGFGANVPSGAIPIGLEGDWLDRFGTVLGEAGRFAERQITVAETVAPPVRLLTPQPLPPTSCRWSGFRCNAISRHSSMRHGAGSTATGCESTLITTTSGGGHCSNSPLWSRLAAKEQKPTASVRRYG